MLWADRLAVDFDLASSGAAHGSGIGAEAAAVG